ncbi:MULTISPECIES: DMT family transporter [unclassified Symbiopectobacterium]|uniref:DMT family transporter n=1 Tax=unclassified Symbiopectobacterium TaxID=2794573 RepID=UPI0022280BEC|nr:MULTISPECIES: DMT family transporter [unclassified Symbiopectobacterium]MCW2473089.1 DMT family transporter [Candidatus Symbiopectobacterium sp. NZEC151]MCW2482535.1 DMT family transporter [Candidatus Symbiopectobacterium sp. NZEC135]MCW2488682.1 DMT family transporter [Candidatus Symbiopectobacterium sp. NZEC127]
MPYLLLTLAALFWGGNYVVGHVLVVRADPIIMTQARWAITAILLMALYFRQVRQHWSTMRTSLGILFFLSVCGQVLFPLTLYIGLQYTTSLNAAIYMSATPAVVLLLNRLVFNDPISRNNMLGVILSTGGVLYLVVKGQIPTSETFNALNQGDLWTMGSALSWAFYCTFLRKKDKSIPGNAFVAVSALLGAILLIPLVFVYVVDLPSLDVAPYFQWDFLTGLAYLVIFPSWLSYVFWNRGISDIGATRGEIYTHLIPLSGGVFSLVFLNTTLEPFHLVSALLIVFGIWLCSKTPQQA